MEMAGSCCPVCNIVLDGLVNVHTGKLFVLFDPDCSPVYTNISDMQAFNMQTVRLFAF